MNWPNRLTLARIVATFVFLGLFAVPERVAAHLICWRIGFVIAVLAGLTDFFDGYLARRYQMVTEFGRLLDPLSDKIFIVSAFVSLSERHLVPAWVTSLILAREFAVTGLRTLAANKGVTIHVTVIAKWKTTVQMVAVTLAGLYVAQWWPAAWWDWYVAVPLLGHCQIWDVVVTAVAYVTIYTGIDYFWKSRHLYLGQM